MSIFGMFAGTAISLLTYRESWLIFGVTTGPVVGLASGLISTVIFWIQYTSSYEPIVRNPTIDIFKGSMIGLVTGLIIGIVAGYATDFIFRIPSRNSLDTPSLGSQKRNYVPTGIAKVLILILSFLISLGGIIIGLNYLKRPDFENQRFAKQVFIVSGAGFVFSIVRVLVFNALS